MSTYLWSDGPFHVRKIDDSIGGIDDVSGEPIGQAFDCGYQDRRNGHVKRLANTTLFATSFELYEALSYARRFLKKADHDTDYVDRVLAKARGDA